LVNNYQNGAELWGGEEKCLVVAMVAVRKKEATPAGRQMARNPAADSD